MIYLSPHLRIYSSCESVGGECFLTFSSYNVINNFLQNCLICPTACTTVANVFFSINWVVYMFSSIQRQEDF